MTMPEPLDPSQQQSVMAQAQAQAQAQAPIRFRPKLASNLLLWLIFGFFVAALLWAAFTELDRTVRGFGRVIPSSQLQTISNLEGGIVKQILVKTGQDVKAGDPLVSLDPTQSGAELGSGSATVMALRAKIQRLEAEVTGRPLRFVAIPERNILDIETALHNARIAELSSLRSAGEARATASSRAVNEAQSIYAARRSAAVAAQAELDAIRPLVERGIEPRLTLNQAIGRAQSASSEAAAASSAIARAQAGIAEARAATNQQVQDWRSRSANELTNAQAELSARQSALPALADRVDRTTVTAPVSGRINRVLITTVGGTVPPGGPLLEIVPSKDGLLIEAQLNPKDIASVRMGQEAKVSLTAYDSAIYGSLKGKVIAISPDAIINEKTGESFYIVQVRTNETALKPKKGGRLPIGVGMVADVSLLGDKRTVLDYLLSPITKLREEAFRE